VAGDGVAADGAAGDGVAAWSFLDWPHPIPFAHRGGGGEWPENTMLAFASAVSLGYRYLETDVRLTSDGVLVAFHDDVLDHVSDRTGRIAEVPWAEVRQARVQGEPIPLMEDVLGAWPEARVNIDAKADDAVPALVDSIGRTSAHARVCVGSFVDRRVHRLRAATGGRVCTWMGRRQMARLRLASLGLPGSTFAPCAQVPTRYGRVPVVDRRFVDAAHRRGVAVQVWTVNERAEMERLLDLGVDGILSDRPTLLKQVMVERGLWVGWSG
jgi:glycerophosphoryl diester phosphodiesterase